MAHQVTEEGAARDGPTDDETFAARVQASQRERLRSDAEPHGLRVRIGGKLIAYSGDARWSDALPRLAEGADLFICETTTYSTPDPVHLSARELVAHRAELRCGRVIATHLGRESIEHLAELGVEHAEDGMSIEL